MKILLAFTFLSSWALGAADCAREFFVPGPADSMRRVDPSEFQLEKLRGHLAASIRYLLENPDHNATLSIKKQGSGVHVTMRAGWPSMYQVRIRFLNKEAALRLGYIRLRDYRAEKFFPLSYTNIIPLHEIAVLTVDPGIVEIALQN
jgi:hypothetical protein